jgi:A/G-specific adenine glycosylase
MLQQTQVKRVTEKYPQFIKKFPTFMSLSKASLIEVLQEWQGLGYNRRAKYLYEIAKKVVSEYKGILPDDPEILVTFPGIGKATASSITTFAFNIPTVFIETNIRRVFIHHFFSTKDKIDDTSLLPLIERTVDIVNPREWYYALMDYGTYLKTIVDNPNKKSKHYSIQSQFKGSTREIRSLVIKLLLNKSLSLKELQAVIKDERLEKIITDLEKEKFIVNKNNKYIIKS